MNSTDVERIERTTESYSVNVLIVNYCTADQQRKLARYRRGSRIVLPIATIATIVGGFFECGILGLKMPVIYIF